MLRDNKLLIHQTILCFGFISTIWDQWDLFFLSPAYQFLYPLLYLTGRLYSDGRLHPRMSVNWSIDLNQLESIITTITILTFTKMICSSISFLVCGSLFDLSSSALSRHLACSSLIRMIHISHLPIFSFFSSSCLRLKSSNLERMITWRLKLRLILQ